jgi:hypothetical protein
MLEKFISQTSTSTLCRNTRPRQSHVVELPFTFEKYVYVIPSADTGLILL